MESARVTKLLSYFGAPTVTALLLIIWEVTVRVLGVSVLILPPPSMIGSRLSEIIQDPETWSHTATTATQTIIGFGIAVLVGVTFGVLLGKIPWLELTLRPILVLLYVIPNIAFVPIFVIWFGFGMGSKIVIASVLAFFPIMLNVLLGVKSVDPGLREVMSSLNATRAERFRNLEVRAVMPYLLAGMETGIVLAIIGSIVGEYLGGNEGLGYLIVRTMNELDAAGLFAVIVILALLGLTLYGIVVGLKRFLIPWHESVYAQQGASV